MAKVLMIGCGDLGAAIAMRLFNAGHTLTGVRRGSQPLPHGMQTIQADVTQPNTLSQLQSLNPNIIIYCVSASGSTDAQYHAAYVKA